MPNPTTSWICDVCREPIHEACEGWVEWIHVIDSMGCPIRFLGLQIVHHATHSPRPSGCQTNASRKIAGQSISLGDDALVQFQGADGLMRLLRKIAEGSLPTPNVLEII